MQDFLPLAVSPPCICARPHNTDVAGCSWGFRLTHLLARYVVCPNPSGQEGRAPSLSRWPVSAIRIVKDHYEYRDCGHKGVLSAPRTQKPRQCVLVRHQPGFSYDPREVPGCIQVTPRVVRRRLRHTNPFPGNFGTVIGCGLGKFLMSCVQHERTMTAKRTRADGTRAGNAGVLR